MEIFRQKGIEILMYPEPGEVLAGGFSMGQICSVLAMNRVQEVQVMINTDRYTIYPVFIEIYFVLKSHETRQLSVPLPL